MAVKWSGMKDFTSELITESHTIHRRVKNLTEEQKITCLALDSIVRSTMATQKVEQAILTLWTRWDFNA